MIDKPSHDEVDVANRGDVDTVVQGDRAASEATGFLEPKPDAGSSVADEAGGAGAGEPRAKAPSVAEGGTPVEGSALSQEELDELTEAIIAAIKTVYDPEIPADIYEIGLIYRIDISDNREIVVDMTLTAPGCPVAGEMPQWVEDAVSSVPGVGPVTVNLTFDPPWDPSRMSDEARLAIGMF